MNNPNPSDQKSGLLIKGAEESWLPKEDIDWQPDPSWRFDRREDGSWHWGDPDVHVVSVEEANAGRSRAIVLDFFGKKLEFVVDVYYERTPEGRLHTIQYVPRFEPLSGYRFASLEEKRLYLRAGLFLLRNGFLEIDSPKTRTCRTIVIYLNDALSTARDAGLVASLQAANQKKFVKKALVSHYRDYVSNLKRRFLVLVIFVPVYLMARQLGVVEWVRGFVS